jgi:hypothetical protein
MMFTFSSAVRLSRFVSKLLLLALIAGPVAAQQPAQPKPPPQAAASEPAPTFDELLATDTYKLYGEVRNVGTLLSNGGAGEIVDPIVKLADPGAEFKSIISFLKKNAEPLAQARLMFATMPVRTDLPPVFVAIEFPTNEDAAKFAPKLETFLPTVLPPVPVAPDPSPATESKPKDNPGRVPDPKLAQGKKPIEIEATTMVKDQATTSPIRRPGSPSPVEERLPFVITHAGNLVCITDKSFKFTKLRPRDSHALFRDQNFRTARDQFSSEPVFFFFNVALEDKSKASPSPTPIAADETARMNSQNTEEPILINPVALASPVNEPSPILIINEEKQTAVLTAGPVTSPSPTPTPTKEEQAQRIASNQIGQLLDSIGYGEPQWPEAVGLAVALEGNEYVVRAIMIDKPEAKKTPIPFVPQLIGGPAFNSEAASILPDDTDFMISASIDLVQTFEGMRKAEEKKHKEDARARSQTWENGVLVSQGAPRNESPDVFAAFEKNAGLKIKDDLLPAFGHELAIAGSLKNLNAAGLNVMGLPNPPAPSEVDKDGQKKKEPAMPALLIEVKDRDAARPLMPKILSGLGVGEANLIAQTEKHGDTEMVNYAGIFAYAFVGDFVVISDALGVRKIVDAYVNHQTLSSNTVFRNARRWQSSRTTGQVYVSPALMDGYQNEIRKSAASMDTGLRDFLLGLSPNAEAVTYALADDGMGTRHELHLPKNYILMTVASVSSVTKNPPAEMNEAVAAGILQWVASAETQYKAGPGKGSYGSLQQLVDAKLMSTDQFDKYGYRYDVSATGAAFEATATPKEYGKSGKRSFYIDQTGVVRGDDHGGGAATAADKPVQP